MTFNYAGLFAKMQQQERIERVQRLIAGECDIADNEAEDEELTPDEIASLEEALSEPDCGPFSTEQLAQMVDSWQEFYCIDCEQPFPREQLVCCDVFYDEHNQEVPVYTCQACNPVGWKFMKKEI